MSMPEFSQDVMAGMRVLWKHEYLICLQVHRRACHLQDSFTKIALYLVIDAKERQLRFGKLLRIGYEDKRKRKDLSVTLPTIYSE